MVVRDISSHAAYVHAEERNFTILLDFNHSKRIDMCSIIN
jgi:hypothetical protein